LNTRVFNFLWWGNLILLSLDPKDEFGDVESSCLQRIGYVADPPKRSIGRAELQVFPWIVMEIFNAPFETL
jgi:hypothetical protein